MYVTFLFKCRWRVYSGKMPNQLRTIFTEISALLKTAERSLLPIYKILLLVRYEKLPGRVPLSIVFVFNSPRRRRCHRIVASAVATAMPFQCRRWLPSFTSADAWSPGGSRLTTLSIDKQFTMSPGPLVGRDSDPSVVDVFEPNQPTVPHTTST